MHASWAGAPRLASLDGSRRDETGPIFENRDARLSDLDDHLASRSSSATPTNSADLPATVSPLCACCCVAQHRAHEPAAVPALHSSRRRPPARLPAC